MSKSQSIQNNNFGTELTNPLRKFLLEFDPGEASKHEMNFSKVKHLIYKIFTKKFKSISSDVVCVHFCSGIPVIFLPNVVHSVNIDIYNPPLSV